MINRQKTFVIIVILSLGIAGWWFWRSKSGLAVQPKAASKSFVASSSSNATPPQSLDAAAQALLNSPNLDPKVKEELQQHPGLAQKLLQFMAARDAANSQSINVYGKVVDQYGAPISGVTVNGGTLLYVSPDASGGQQFTTTTDAQGLFAFTGLNGARFGVKLEKDGYEFDQKLYTTWWNSYKPDPSSPMVFTMWKIQGAESMTHQDFHFLIPCDGTSVSVNLETGKQVRTGGDLNISFSRNPVQIHRGTPFEWALTLDVPNGGLQEIQDPYPYEAPANGYQPSITITTGPNPPNYVDSVEKSYYYQSPDGKYYGRITIILQADFQPPPTFFHIDAYINPSGSHNLEPEQLKAAQPGQPLPY